MDKPFIYRTSHTYDMIFARVSLHPVTREHKITQNDCCYARRQKNTVMCGKLTLVIRVNLT